MRSAPIRSASLAAYAIARPIVDEVVLRLPMPPSTNRLWKPRAGGGMMRDDGYEAWIEKAGWELLVQRPGRIEAHYDLRLSACRTETRADLSNLLKAPEDLLERHGVIRNDKLSRVITTDWTADTGIILTVRSVS